jgi:hypothetical protein
MSTQRAYLLRIESVSTIEWLEHFEDACKPAYSVFSKAGQST